MHSPMFLKGLLSNFLENSWTSVVASPAALRSLHARKTDDKPWLQEWWTPIGPRH